MKKVAVEDILATLAVFIDMNAREFLTYSVCQLRPWPPPASIAITVSFTIPFIYAIFVPEYQDYQSVCPKYGFFNATVKQLTQDIVFRQGQYIIKHDIVLLLFQIAERFGH